MYHQDMKGRYIRLKRANMLCTKQDSYIHKLLMEDIEILWKCTLTDGQVVWSDYDRPGETESPWHRLMDFCDETGECITKVQALVFGAPQEILFDNPNGLDGLFVVRGVSKDINMESGAATAFQHLTAGVLNDNLETVDVRKFSWPLCEFEAPVQTRMLTPENAQLMIFKDGSKKKQSEQVQVALNG